MDSLVAWGKGAGPTFVKLGALVVVLCLGLVITSSGHSAPHKRFANCTHAVAIGCELRSDGNVTLRGSIRVRPETRCAKRIYITTGVTTCEPTVNHPCPASLQIAELFKGLPRGC